MHVRELGNNASLSNSSLAGWEMQGLFEALLDSCCAPLGLLFHVA